MTTAGITIVPLSQRPEAVEQVARWIDAEWGRFSGRSYAETLARFADEPRAAALPTTCIALERGAPLGVASLRLRDSVDWDPGVAPWICNVYVHGDARGRGIAASLCGHLEQLAAESGYPLVYLASRIASGSVYERIGYSVYRSIAGRDEPMHLMRRALRDSAARTDVSA